MFLNVYYDNQNIDYYGLICISLFFTVEVLGNYLHIKHPRNITALHLELCFGGMSNIQSHL